MLHISQRRTYTNMASAIALGIKPTPIPGGPVLEDHMRSPLGALTWRATEKTYQAQKSNPDLPADIDTATTPIAVTRDVWAALDFHKTSISDSLTPVAGGFDDALRAARDIINTGKSKRMAVISPTPDTFALINTKLGERAVTKTGPTARATERMTEDQIDGVMETSDKYSLFDMARITKQEDFDRTKVAPNSQFVRAFVEPDGFFDLRQGAIGSKA